MLPQRTAATDAIRGCRRAAHAGPGCPTTAPAAAQRAGSLEHVVGLGPQLVLDRLEHLSHRGQRVGVGLDPLAHGVGGVPQLLARELEGDERRRPGRPCGGRRARRCWRTGCPEPRRRAAEPHRRDAARQFGDHGRGGDAHAADVHADADAAEVLAHPAPAARGPGRRCPGAPQGPVPWSRRWAAVAAGGEPAGCGLGEKTAARRQADVGVPVSSLGRGSGRSRRPGPGRPRPASTRSRCVIRLEMAAPPGKGAAAKSEPAVSRTKTCVGSATRNEES